MSAPYWTPLGQAVTQDKQPRQESKCSVKASSIGTVPSSPAFIR